MPPTNFGLPIREYLLVALVAATLTFLLTALIKRFALRVGAVAIPRDRDVHTAPIPRMGGVAIYFGVCGGMALAHQLPVLRRAFEFSLDPVAVLVGGGVIVLIGALDDRFELDAWTKLAGQVMCAGLLVLFGLQWMELWVPWGADETSVGSVLVLDRNQGALFTVLLVVVMVNAMNFVDGLDGLASGLGLIAATATCAFSLGVIASTNNYVGAYPPALIAATLAGACAGFLPHNFQPAKIFMGDSGSMLIGLMLASASVSASGRIPYPEFEATDLLGLLSPLVVVAAVLFLPVLDLLMAIVRRARRGHHPFSPDKMHLHHRLLEIGHSHRRAVLLIYLWAGLLAFGAVSITLFDSAAVLWITGIGLLLALIVSAIPRLKSRNQSKVS